MRYRKKTGIICLIFLFTLLTTSLTVDAKLIPVSVRFIPTSSDKFENSQSYNLPNALFSWTDIDEEEESIILFDASASSSEYGISLFEWDFDNDGLYDISSSSPTIYHEYYDTNIHKCGLRVTDIFGQESSIVHTINTLAPESNTIKGDVNGDNAINIEDVIYLTNYVFNKEKPLLTDGDFNIDGKINLRDIFELINLVF